MEHVATPGNRARRALNFGDQRSAGLKARTPLAALSIL